GLLSEISQIFIANDIQLHDAKITTIGSRAEDIFYVTTPDGTLLTIEQEKTLKVALLALLNEDSVAI
ncbi:MAG: hypothetical protein KAH08_09190, partial [Methylococcales bacterium]|nr:hypothetical protein [Methylococcales bacterium]